MSVETGAETVGGGIAEEALDPGGTGQAASQVALARRRKRRHLAAVMSIRFGFVAVLLVFWQMTSVWFPGDKFIFSSPTDIVARFGQMIHSGELWVDTAATLEEVVYGYLIGCVVGIAMGFWFGRSKFIAEVFEPVLVGLYGIPRIALAPLFILWLGIGIASKIGIVILLVFFLIFFNTYSGMREVDRDYINLARLMGASEWTVMRRVIFPAVSPYIMIGLKTSVPMAVIGAVVGEFIVSTKGLGYLIREASGLFDASGLFVGVIVLLVIVLIANYLLDALERRLMRWRPSSHDEHVVVEG